MPQLDFSTFPGQIFWLAVTFVLLYIISSRLVLPRVSEVLENRNAHIAGDLDKAENMKLEAETVETKTDKTLHTASEEARAIIDESNEKVSMKLEKKRAELNVKLDKKMETAEKHIAEIEAESERVIKKISNDISKIMEEKLVA